MTDLTQFRTRKFSDIASDLIREEILSGKLAPGDRINELALSDRLQISRSPLREALRDLNGEGLVRMVPGRGAFVASPDAEGVNHLGEVRLAIEMQVARLAAERIDDAGRDRLKSVMDQLENVLSNPARSYPHQIDFHHALGQVTQNPKLLQYSDEIERQLRVARLARGAAPDRAQEVLREHRAVFEAVVTGDPDAAAEQMRLHMIQSTRSIVAMIHAHTLD